MPKQFPNWGLMEFLSPQMASMFQSQLHWVTMLGSITIYEVLYVLESEILSWFYSWKTSQRVKEIFNLPLALTPKGYVTFGCTKISPSQGLMEFSFSQTTPMLWSQVCQVILLGLITAFKVLSVLEFGASSRFCSWKMPIFRS